MLKEEEFGQQHHQNNRGIQLRHNKPYSLRVPGNDTTPPSSDQDSDGEEKEDTLRIMPPENYVKPPSQPLSLPEKKFLHDFWTRQWAAFKAAPACQNVPEKRLREKFDGYISINIRRYLLKDWNNTFAGGYVLGEPAQREERDADDLRTLTKKWAWLCKELGFKPWRGAIDDQDERLDNIKFDVRNELFGVQREEARNNDTMGGDTTEQGGVVLTERHTITPRKSNGMQDQIPQELVNIDIRLMEAAQSHFHEMKAAHESDVVNKEGIMRNDSRFDLRVFVCMMTELRDMEDQGFLSSDVARVVRALVLQDISS